jgi:hypothetical protein
MKITTTNEIREQKQQAEAEKQTKKLRQSGLLFSLLALFIIGGTVIFHSLPRYQELQATQIKITSDQVELDSLEQEKKKLKTSIEEKTNVYKGLEDELGPKLNIVFPVGEEIFSLTNFLEDYAIRYHSEENPMVLNNINYGKPQSKDDYFVLPIRMNLEASEGNFRNFLNMIQRSGSLAEADYFRDKPIRLMTIESINASVPKVDNENLENAIYTFSIEVNAYFRPEPPEQAGQRSANN